MSWKSVRDFCTSEQLERLDRIRDAVSGFADPEKDHCVTVNFSQIVGTLVDPFPNIDYVLSYVDALMDNLDYPHVHRFIREPHDEYTGHWWGFHLEKRYGRLSIVWYRPDIDKDLEDFVVDSVNSLMPKFVKCFDFIKGEALSKTHIEIVIYPTPPRNLAFDVWYDHIAKAGGMWIKRQLPEEYIAEVKFPEEIYL